MKKGDFHLHCPGCDKFHVIALNFLLDLVISISYNTAIGEAKFPLSLLKAGKDTFVTFYTKFKISITNSHTATFCNQEATHGVCATNVSAAILLDLDVGKCKRPFFLLRKR